MRHVVGFPINSTGTCTPYVTLYAVAVADAGDSSPLAAMQRSWNLSANWAPNIQSIIYT